MTEAQIGRTAPDFTLTDQHGRRVTLSDYRGAAVLLVFVPFAFSDTCTNELIELRDAPDLTEGRALEVIVISCDSIYTLKAWADAHGYGGELLSDFWPHGEASRDYGVFNPQKGLATRGTFLIDPQGVVAWSVVNPVGEARDIEDYRAAIAAL
ncbi:peroxiredoxin [Demequina sp. NBRC 110056]|uniref:peroxiredoxin n=1 Tax=Demequina sp. NBRC 110056 TaxID=1570345 RepID=UPI0009FE4774|nr:peroxiredoxin [Demequina sp. NBRC 110056]